ncbi:MAG: hypothetical protein J6R71_02885, partial [Bacteroidales bacterium]|nr:hypothetical protein [Bacteroidales bacterium]
GKLYQAYLAGDFEKTDYYQALTDLVAVVYQKGRTLGESLAALKVLMQDAGLCSSTMMPPLTELSSEENKRIIEQFKALSL